MQGRNWGRVTAALLAGAVVFLRGGPASADNRWGADYFPNVPRVTQEGAGGRLYDRLALGRSVVDMHGRWAPGEQRGGCEGVGSTATTRRLGAATSTDQGGCEQRL